MKPIGTEEGGVSSLGLGFCSADLQRRPSVSDEHEGGAHACRAAELHQQRHHLRKRVGEGRTEEKGAFAFEQGV